MKSNIPDIGEVTTMQIEPEPDPNWRSLYFVIKQDLKEEMKKYIHWRNMYETEKALHEETKRVLNRLRDAYDSLMNDWLEL